MAAGLKTGTFALLLYLLSMTLPTTNARSNLTPEHSLNVLEVRQSTCPSSNPVSCTALDPKLPSNFCCPSGSTCISTDSSSSALCCPAGASCSAIQIISCNVGLQNAGSATGPVLTTRLGDRLPTCGDACCPFGYSCTRDNSGNSVCQLITSRAITKPGNSATPQPTSDSTTTSTAATATTSPTTSAAASGIDSTQPQAAPKSNSFPPGVFLAGFFPGILVGALGVLGWVILTGRNKKQQNTEGPPRGASMYGTRPEISDPMMDPGQSTRSDFARRTNTFARSAKSLFAKKDPSGGTPGLPFDNAENWRELTPPERNNVPDQLYRRTIQAGPQARMPQTPDSEQSMDYAGARRGQRAQSGYTESTGYGETNSAYPRTPNRDRYSGESEDPEGEIIRIYTPPNINRPSAAVAPLRGMSSQRRSRDSGVGFGGGYNDDGKRGDARVPYPASRNDTAYEASNYETLTPARYDGGGSQRRPRQQNTGSRERPETTFTEMLRQINFPDPMKDGNAPAMPSIPKQYR